MSTPNLVSNNPDILVDLAANDTPATHNETINLSGDSDMSTGREAKDNTLNIL